MLFLSLLFTFFFTICGSFYARKFNKPDALIAFYVCFVISAQISATKIVSYDFSLFKITAPGAVEVFAATFLIMDIVNEKFGQRQVHIMVLIAFITQIVLLLFLYIVGELPPAEFWHKQEAWDAIFSTIPRITIAGWIAFLVSENLNAWLFALMKRYTKGKYLWIRSLFSTVPSLTLDTFLFVTLAFAGTGVSLWAIMTGQFVMKYLVSFISIPLIYLNRRILR